MPSQSKSICEKCIAYKQYAGANKMGHECMFGVWTAVMTGQFVDQMSIPKPPTIKNCIDYDALTMRKKNKNSVLACVGEGECVVGNNYVRELEAKVLVVE